MMEDLCLKMVEELLFILLLLDCPYQTMIHFFIYGKIHRSASLGALKYLAVFYQLLSLMLSFV